LTIEEMVTMFLISLRRGDGNRVVFNKVFKMFSLKKNPKFRENILLLTIF